MNQNSRLLFTMGDVAGIGPEIIAKAWPTLVRECKPVVVGDPEWLQRALTLIHSSAKVITVGRPDEMEPDAELVPCLSGSEQRLHQVKIGRISAESGRAAYDFLCKAIDLTLAGEADAIVTAPLHKEGLRAAGVPFPGHTEILAERTGAKSHAMLLYCQGLAVAHVTLHVALRDVFQYLTPATILEKIRLIDGLMSQIIGRRPKIGVAALNPHGGEGGLFGDEEMTIIQPAVDSARSEGIDATGPWPSDTLFVRAKRGEFEGVVVMYHDQGHIAVKLLSDLRAVNVTAGLPLVRTSVAHGTAYDIAGRGIADEGSLIDATKVAVILANSRRQ